VTFPAFRWLYDTGAAFSYVDHGGHVILASGPHGADQPALRRAQALICSGVRLDTANTITREILRAKLAGQAAVAQRIGGIEACEAIAAHGATLAHETAGDRMLSIEAQAALAYWYAWKNVPVRFARDNPPRLDVKGRWRPGRAAAWHSFGARTSPLTGKPWRATTPGNAMLNFLFGIARAEMTIALLAAGLDPGIGLFHADVDRRPSLAFDALEAIRPACEAWLLAFLESTAFANRDFTETPEGEVRMTHPLSAHMAHTAALWRPLCEHVAAWLALAIGGEFATLKLPSASPRKLQHPVPWTCLQCAKALAGHRRKFCSAECAERWHGGNPQRRSMEAIHRDGLHQSPAAQQRRSAAASASRAAELAWRQQPGWSKADDDARRVWYRSALLPALANERPAAIRDAMGCTLPAAIEVRAGRLIPHPRHYERLAALLGIK
jgi:CRISPR-associated endonuclease Cas1